jgi:hypothetical protein
MLFHAILSFALAGMVACAAVLERATLGNYTIENVTWVLDLGNGQAPIHINGTIQDIQAYMNKTNATLVPTRVKDDAAATTSLAPYPAVLQGGPYCSVSKLYGWATCGPVQDGEMYLVHLKGGPINGPGPSACGRVSCSYGSGTLTDHAPSGTPRSLPPKVVFAMT